MPDELQELGRRYHQTYIGLRKPDGSIEPVMFNQFSGNHAELMIVSTNLSASERIAVAVDSDDIVWEYPDLGLINFKNFFMYLSRQATRQWRWGIVIGDIFTDNPFNSEFQLYSVKGYNWQSKELFTEIFNKTYPEYPEALKLIMSHERIGVAFSDKYGIGARIGYKLPCLFMRSTPVGLINESGTVLLHEKAMCLREEIEMFSRVEGFK